MTPERRKILEEEAIRISKALGKDEEFTQKLLENLIDWDTRLGPDQEPPPITAEDLNFLVGVAS